MVPFNDLDALERALDHGDVAAVLMEPALTNIGIVLPEAGYLDGVRQLTRTHGSWLVIDETHTICAGPGGCTAAWGLDPDAVVVGKPIGGVCRWPPTASPTRSPARLVGPMSGHDSDVAGVGGTLSGSALALAAVRATLSTTLLEADYERMIPLAERWTAGVAAAIEQAASTGPCSASVAGPSTGSARRPVTVQQPPPRSTTNSTRSCTCGRSTAAC